MENVTEEVKRPRGRPSIIGRSLQRSEQRAAAKAMLKDWDEDDKYHIYPEEVPEGISYEWKRVSIYGQEDKSHQVKLRQMGYWQPVAGRTHPRFGFIDDQPIVIDGLMLMERPIELTEERLDREKKKANSQVSGQMKALEMGGKDGQLEGRQTRVKRTMEIPD